MIRTVAKQKRTEAQIERDIAIYKRQMRGLSVRAIADEFGIKSTQTVHIAIQRGREHAKLRGIDPVVEQIRPRHDQQRPAASPPSS
jgi:transposase